METLPIIQQPTCKEFSTESPARSLVRSRVVVSQSKKGCVTCKVRRVKCDEQKPLCRRCMQAGRLCGGYNQVNKSLSSLRPALKFGVTADNHTERLCYLAAHVLSLDNNGRLLQDDDAWGSIFLQMSNQVECVKAAAAAFGAAYESLFDNNVTKGPRSAWSYYGSALARFRSDLDNDSVGSECLTLASIILASIEILSQHEQNAFAHFLGAVQILTKASGRRQGSAPSEVLNSLKQTLVRVNLLVSSYGLSQTPQLMYLDAQDAIAGDDAYSEPESAINAATLCLHRSYQFLASADRLRYTYPSWKEHDPLMCEAQSDAAADCHFALDGLMALATKLQAYSSPSTPTLRESETLAEIYALRTQLTSTMLFILCVHDRYETVYDQHQDLFRSIVADAAASARLRRRTKPNAFNRFSTRPGIVSPLFIVSIKCRDPSLRALATTMLREQGREGPADGQILAAVGVRLAAFETSSVGVTPSFPCAPLGAFGISEEQRVHGYTAPDSRLNEEGRRVVDVIFSRPHPPLAQGWGHVDYTCPDGWKYWTEVVEV